MPILSRGEGYDGAPWRYHYLSASLNRRAIAAGRLKPKSKRRKEPQDEKPGKTRIPAHLAPGGQVWIYELPAQLDDRATPNPQAAIQAQLIRSLRASPYVASEPGAASFFLVPLPFDGNPGFQGREDSGAVLSYVRHTWPWFNASLRRSEPNHLLTFVGDHGIDLAVRTATGHGAKGQGGGARTSGLLREAKPRSFGPAVPLPPEIDAAGRLRHWVQLTMSGNPEVRDYTPLGPATHPQAWVHSIVPPTPLQTSARFPTASSSPPGQAGFMAGRDVVLPPNYRLKNGPRHNRCNSAKAGGKVGGKVGGKGGGKGGGLRAPLGAAVHRHLGGPCLGAGARHP